MDTTTDLVKRISITNLANQRVAVVERSVTRWTCSPKPNSSQRRRILAFRGS